MPKSKSRRKSGKTPNNKARVLAGIHKKIREIASRHYIVYAPILDKALHVYTRDGEEAFMDKQTIEFMESTPVKWVFHCYCCCRDQNGDQYWKYIELPAAQPCKRMQAMDSMADSFMNFIQKQCNTLHILSAVWMATAEGNDPSDEIADKIISELDIWGEFQTDWEEQTGKFKRKENEKSDLPI